MWAALHLSWALCPLLPGWGSHGHIIHDDDDDGGQLLYLLSTNHSPGPARCGSLPSETQSVLPRAREAGVGLLLRDRRAWGVREVEGAMLGCEPRLA